MLLHHTMAHAVANIKKLGKSRIKVVHELNQRAVKYQLAFGSTVSKLKRGHLRVFSITVHSKFKIVLLIQLQT